MVETVVIVVNVDIDIVVIKRQMVLFFSPYPRIASNFLFAWT